MNNCWDDMTKTRGRMSKDLVQDDLSPRLLTQKIQFAHNYINFNNLFKRHNYQVEHAFISKSI